MHEPWKGIKSFYLSDIILLNVLSKLSYAHGHVIKIDMSLIIMFIHRSFNVCIFHNHVVEANATFDPIKQKFNRLHKNVGYHPYWISLTWFVAILWLYSFNRSLIIYLIWWRCIRIHRWGILPWLPQPGLLYWRPIFKSSHCNLFIDRILDTVTRFEIALHWWNKHARQQHVLAAVICSNRCIFP